MPCGKTDPVNLCNIHNTEATVPKFDVNTIYNSQAC